MHCSLGGIWKGDILIADIEELEILDASKIYPGRLNAKEVLVTQKNREFVFPVADGSAKLWSGDHEFREPTPRREQIVRSKGLSGDSHGAAEESQPAEQEDETAARKRFSGLCKEISSTVITLNREFNFMCQQKQHLLFQQNTLMSQDRHLRIWTLHKKNELMIIGNPMKTNICQIRGFTKFCTN